MSTGLPEIEQEPVRIANRWFDPTQPLWLPAGSVRAVLTLALLATTTAIFMVRNSAPEPIVLLTVYCVKDYFQARQGNA